MKTLLASIAAMMFVAATASANHYGDTYVIPAAGNVTGAYGSTWMTDVAITNFQNDPLEVDIIVVETGENMPDNIFPLTTSAVNGFVTVPANATVLLKDVLNGHRGKSNVSGALILGADRPFAVTSRTYNSTSGGIGSTVTPARDFIENSTGRSDNTSIAYLPDLVNNASTRTNIGFVAGNADFAGALGVEIRVRNAAGNIIGTRTFILPTSTFTQVQVPISTITSTQFDIGSADVRIVGGSGAVVPFASVISNSTGASAYITGQFPNNTPITNSSSATNVFRNLFSRLSNTQ